MFKVILLYSTDEIVKRVLWKINSFIHFFIWMVVMNCGSKKRYFIFLEPSFLTCLYLKASHYQVNIFYLSRSFNLNAFVKKIIKKNSLGQEIKSKVLEGYGIPNHKGCLLLLIRSAAIVEIMTQEWTIPENIKYVQEVVPLQEK